MGVPGMVNFLADADKRDRKQRDDQAKKEDIPRNASEDLFVFAPSVCEAVRACSEYQQPTLHFVDGGQFYATKLRAVRALKAVSTKKADAIVEVRARVKAAEEDYAHEILRSTAPGSSVVVVNDHPDMRPVVKHMTAVKRYKRRTHGDLSSKRRREKSQQREQHAAEYRWSVDDISFEIADSSHDNITFVTAEHEADPHIYHLACREESPNCPIYFHGVDTDLLPLGVATAKVCAWIAPAKASFRTVRLNELRSSRFANVWPFHKAEAAALAILLCGNDYSNGLLGMGLKRLVSPMQPYIDIIAWCKKDWHFLADSPPVRAADHFDDELQKLAKEMKRDWAKQVERLKLLKYVDVRDKVRVMLGVPGMPTETKEVARHRALEARAAETAKIQALYPGSNIYFKSVHDAQLAARAPQADDVVRHVDGDEEDEILEVVITSPSTKDRLEKACDDAASDTSEDVDMEPDPKEKGDEDDEQDEQQEPAQNAPDALQKGKTYALGCTRIEKPHPELDASAQHRHRTQYGTNQGYTVKVAVDDTPGLQGLVKAVQKVQLAVDSGNLTPSTRSESSSDATAKNTRPASIAEMRRAAKQRAREAELAEDSGAEDEGSGKGRAGFKHQARKSTIVKPLSTSIRDIDCASGSENTTRPGKAFQHVLEAVAFNLGTNADIISRILPILRREASEIYPLHQLLFDLLDPSNFTICCDNIQLVWQHLQDRGSRTIVELGKLAGDGVVARHSDEERIEKAHWGGYSPNVDESTTFRSMLANYQSDVQELMAARKIPPFFFEACRTAYKDLRLEMAPVPRVVFVDSYKKVGVGHRTAAIRQTPQLIAQLTRALAVDFCSKPRSFVETIGKRLHVAYEEPAATTACLSFLGDLASDAAVSVGARAALASALETIILESPLYEDEDDEGGLPDGASGSVKHPREGDTSGWRAQSAERIKKMLTCYFERRKSEAAKWPSGTFAATATYIVDTINEVRKVLRAGYQRLGGRSRLILQDWIKEPSCDVKVFKLAAFQEGWKRWMETDKALAMHGRSVTVTSQSLSSIIAHFEELANTAARNVNMIDTSIQDTLSTLQATIDMQPFVTTLSFLSTADGKCRVDTAARASALALAALVRSTLDGVKQRYDRQIQIGDSFVPLLNMVCNTPDRGRLVPAACFTVSLSTIHFLMLDPARIKNSSKLGAAKDHVEVVNRLFSRSGPAARSGHEFNTLNWARLQETRAFAKLEATELVGNGQDSDTKSSRPISPLFRTKGSHSLEWVHRDSRSRRPVETLTSTRKSASFNIASSVRPQACDRIIRNIVTLSSKLNPHAEPFLATVSSPSAATSQLDPLASPFTPETSTRSTTGSRSLNPQAIAFQPSASTSASTPTPAKKLKTDASKVPPAPPFELPSTRLSLADIPPGALIIGVDRGEHNSFAATILPSLDEGGTTQAKTYYLRSRQMVAQEQAFQVAQQKSADTSEVKQLVEKLAHLDLSDDHPAVYLASRAWDRDRERRNLVFEQQQQHSARLQHTMKEVVRDIANEAAKRAPEGAKSPYLVLIADGVGLSRERSKSATGADRRWLPTQRLYEALKAETTLQVMFVGADEAWSSQSCPSAACRDKCAEENKVINLEYASYIDSDADCFRILRCVHCGVVYDRDYVGSSNIAQILLFKLATGFHLYERNVEEVLGLGLRDGHKSKEEKMMKKKASVKGKEKAE